jgi:hypothetical protein
VSQTDLNKADITARAPDSLCREMALAALVATLSWAMCVYFGRQINYIGDDFGVIVPALQHDLIGSLLVNIRPLEFFVAEASALLHGPFWLLVSLLTYVVTAVATVQLFAVLIPSQKLPRWACIMAGTSPLLALSYFQIDTVSQALANLFGVLFALRCMACLTEPHQTRIAAASWQLALLGLLCLLSKETSYGIVFFGSVLVLSRFRLRDMKPLLALLTLLTVAIAASMRHHDITPGAHYGAKANPAYWLFTVVFSALVSLSPVPTSLALTHSWLASPALVAICSLGSLLSLAGIFIYIRPICAAFATASRAVRSPWREWVYRHNTSVLMFSLFALIPSMLFKASEVYATQMQPFLKAALLPVLISASRRRAPTAVFWNTVCSLWVLASVINTVYYATATGYAPQNAAVPHARLIAWLEDATQTAVAARTRAYSNYAFSGADHYDDFEGCQFDITEPRVCLARNIGTGFPIWRGEAPAIEVTSPEAATWRSHRVQFVTDQLNERYSCDLLTSKLELLLRQIGAREDAMVATYGCELGFEARSATVAAILNFSTLEPSSLAEGLRGLEPSATRSDAAIGHWQRLTLSPHQPLGLQAGDCGLIEQFRTSVLPLLPHRGQAPTVVNCQGTDISFSLSAEIFAPARTETQPERHR